MGSSSLVELSRGVAGGRHGPAYVAVRDIRVGERLMEEEPLVSKRFSRRLAEVRDVPVAVFEDLVARILVRLHEGGARGASDRQREDAAGYRSLRASAADVEWANEHFKRAGDAELAAKVRSNAFRLRAKKDKDVLQVYTRSSLFPHSCWPNATCMDTGRSSMAAVAIRPLRAGDAVTIAYADDIMRQIKDRRNLLLRESWGFTCRCARCSGKEPEAPGDADMLTPGLSYEQNYEIDAEFADLETVASSGNRGVKWTGRARKLLGRLAEHDWRAAMLRAWMLEAGLARHPTTARDDVEAQVRSLATLVPALHPCKMQYYDLFEQATDYSDEDTAMLLARLDPHFVDVMRMYSVAPGSEHDGGTAAARSKARSRASSSAASSSDVSDGRTERPRRKIGGPSVRKSGAAAPRRRSPRR